MNPLIKETPVRYSDPAYPGVDWIIYDGPFKDEDGSEYYNFNGSNGCSGEGYIGKGNAVEMVASDYYD